MLNVERCKKECVVCCDVETRIIVPSEQEQEQEQEHEHEHEHEQEQEQLFIVQNTFLTSSSDYVEKKEAILTEWTILEEIQ